MTIKTDKDFVRLARGQGGQLEAKMGKVGGVWKLAKFYLEAGVI